MGTTIYKPPLRNLTKDQQEEQDLIAEREVGPKLCLGAETKQELSDLLDCEYRDSKRIFEDAE